MSKKIKLFLLFDKYCFTIDLYMLNHLLFTKSDNGYALKMIFPPF